MARHDLREASPFQLGTIPLLGRRGTSFVESITGLSDMARRYRELPPTSSVSEFIDQALNELAVKSSVVHSELVRVPREGGVIVVTNHPFGGIEGLVMAQLLLNQRQDIKVLANRFLKRVPELSDLFIGVNPFGGKKAARSNVGPLREALNWVRNGGLLVMFPSGTVSHLRLGQGVTDPEWSPALGRLVRLSGAPVIPAFVPGANGLFFQLSGLIHPRLRTLLLGRELLNKGGVTVNIRFGKVVTPQRSSSFSNERALTDYLRTRSYALRYVPKARGTTREAVDEALEPVAEPVDPAILVDELSTLPQEQRLDSVGELEVWCADAHQIPSLLLELGRLREITFRETGEGTGKARDIDRYDAHYQHLFVWNRGNAELVGAYRLARADVVLKRYGERGLYTHSLFRYRARLLAELNPAIELGRSFVRPEYQRSHTPLLILWKGIGRFVAQHPEYCVLFGPVSISNNYQSISRRLLVAFLRDNAYEKELARLVRPRRPFPAGNRRDKLYCTEMKLDDISELMGQYEKGQTNPGIPILLRLYLKLGGRLLGFNIDPQFRDALDGLIMVDLRETDPKILQRYMGVEPARAFLDWHSEARHSSSLVMERTQRQKRRAAETTNES